MSEFSQRPFAVGSFTGIRSFRVTPEGVLTGVVHREAWLPGVNEAQCAGSSVQAFTSAMQSIALSATDAAWVFTQMGAAMSGRVNLVKRPKPKPAPIPPPARPTHQAGTLNCTCGFYAYFDRGHNPHHHAGQVLGIVEGYGVATVGSRGFRSSKARIRALIGPRRKLNAQYDGIPFFPSIDAALAEFPLTPVEQPDPAVVGSWQRAINQMLGPYRLPKPNREGSSETAQERALRLRRTRNTGPDNPTGLDGLRRRH